MINGLARRSGRTVPARKHVFKEPFFIPPVTSLATTIGVRRSGIMAGNAYTFGY
jgi:hypothetical protein